MNTKSIILCSSFLAFALANCSPAVDTTGGWLSPVKLTDNVFSDEVVSVNYDGTRISYYGDEDGDYDIYFREFARASWGLPLKLTDNETPDTMPVINHDGSKIAYIGGTAEDRDIFFVEDQFEKNVFVQEDTVHT